MELQATSSTDSPPAPAKGSQEQAWLGRENSVERDSSFQPFQIRRPGQAASKKQRSRAEPTFWHSLSWLKIYSVTKGPCCLISTAPGSEGVHAEVLTWLDITPHGLEKPRHLL